MASALPPVPPNGSALPWSGQPGSTRTGWGRNGDTPSAFRSMGRGRFNGRGGRGGRGGHNAGNGQVAPSDNEHKPVPDQVKNKPYSDTSKVATPSTPVTPITSAPTKSSGRPRTARKGSDRTPRKAPMSSDPSPPSHTSSAPSRSSNRRRRPNGGKAVTATPSKSSLSSEASIAQSRPERSSAVIKDVPPHMVATSDAASYDKKHDIDAFVERVRAGAMDRPHTPGSHFDWASDDDDSLPDLPDWGITSGTSEETKLSSMGNVISPILEDALKPLPKIEPETPNVEISDNEQSVEDFSEMAAQTPTSVSVLENEHQDVTPREEKLTGAIESSLPVNHAVPAETVLEQRQAPDEEISAHKVAQQGAGASSESRSPSKPALTLPLHPSLPPKPVTTIELLTSEREARHGDSGSAQLDLPPKPAVTVSEAPFEGGLAQSIHAPSSRAVATQKSPSKLRSPELGLAASIHAPSSSLSAPGQLPELPSSPPAHGRSRMARRGLQHHHGISVPDFPGHHSDSDHVGRGAHEHHTRTHSTPPNATARARSPISTRPIITIDAMSRLARTLGGAAPKREAPTTNTHQN
ncbi:uncharacterized protein LAESUDRAFT_719102 [Laetiporus sulphureus 93-53]|uniref:Uncharacterized protein n=1 Tax=Laetiporus sulphureus 93-53 TaxID=1314785 RepID=A0A165IA55_9APHY|nr:uncharacterized protein LAESUDRAFT_719102 [Laetiporus sulphureus 93-53]KZT12793.1 hypothetical protein LAESUDRAFT_719102 [Laetiporus sulphureus 93-53]